MRGVFNGDARCPWCGESAECAEWAERQEGVWFETVCDRCGRAFEVGYEMEPCFNVALPDEMAVCYADWSSEPACPYWSFAGFCAFDRTHAAARECEANRGCPLGHGREDCEDGR